MFDVSWSELLIVGIVALLVVGPKEMPTLLRTVGKYVGLIKRQAAEFRAQFDEAMREAELDQLRKEVESVKTDAENVIRDAEQSVTREVDDARRALNESSIESSGVSPIEPDAHDANGMPIKQAEPTVNGHVAPSGTPAVEAGAKTEPKAPA